MTHGTLRKSTRPETIPGDSRHLDQRIGRMEQLMSQQGQIDRLERTTVRIAGYIFLLITMLTVLLHKLFDLAVVIIHLGISARHAWPK
jgi:hypothetical protein